MTPELLGLSVFFAFSLALLVWAVLVALAEIKAQAEAPEQLFSESPFFKAVLPFVQHFGRVAGGLRSLDSLREDLRLKLVRSGKIYSINPDEFIGLMMVCSFAGVAVALYFRSMTEIGLDLFLGLVLLVTFLPYLSLRDAIQRRQKAIRKILPYTLDLLCLAVEAGLDFGAALNRIGEKLGKNPLREEIRLLSQDMAMGKSRAESLRDLDYRIGLEELREVTSALIQADELGASLGPTLRIQSRELQRKRFQRAEKKALQAPVLMLIPLVIFIFPLVFMIIFGPLALKVMDMDLMGKFAGR